MAKTNKNPAPNHLSTEAKRLWYRLRSEYELDDSAGLLLLQSALEAFDRLQEARGILASEGCVLLDRWKQARPHPALNMERDARNGMHNALRLLKLAPGAITR